MVSIYKNIPRNNKILTGVTFMRATEKDVIIIAKVNISLACFRFLKNEENSSINPVITHSRPPIWKIFWYIIIIYKTICVILYRWVKSNHDQHEEK